MTREDLKRIIEGITDEQLKSVLDLHSEGIGKAKKDYENIKSENETLTDKITQLSNDAVSVEEYRTKLETLQNEIAEKEEKARLEAEDKELTDSILDAIKDKKFTSDYAKEGVIRDMKNLVAQKENKGKSYAEIFENLIKDRVGILENPNKPADMFGMGNIDSNISEDAMRAVMGLAPNKE